MDELAQKGAAVPEEIREAERLTVFATQLRCPGTSQRITEADHRRMLAIAETVVAWAESELGS